MVSFAEEILRRRSSLKVIANGQIIDRSEW